MLTVYGDGNAQRESQSREDTGKGENWDDAIENDY